jgi:uncharacterized protein (TIGR03083 family)
VSQAPPPPFDQVSGALRASQNRLAETLTALSDEQVTGPSYDDEWTIAQVAGHLGSGADVFGLFLDAGLRQTSAPGVEQFAPVWDRWNAKAPAEQARDVLVADAAFRGRIDALTEDERARWRLEMFGSEQTLAGMLRLRLAEHALHTWDVVVALDPKATLAEDSVPIVIDNVAPLVEHAGKPTATPVTVDVQTTAPHRQFTLDLTTDGARLTPAGTDAATATLRLPGEAFVRLLYGRLDPDHTPSSVRVEGVELDTLRGAFPGV